MNLALSTPGTLHFSSALRDAIISAHTGQVRIEITSPSKTVFSTALYVDTQFRLEIASIIDIHLRTMRLPVATYTIKATTVADNPETKTVTFTAIFSRGKSSLDASVFTSKHYLTLNTLRLLPDKAAFDVVSAYVTDTLQAASLATYYRTTYRNTLKSKIIAYDLTPGYNRIDINFQEIIDAIALTEDTSPENIIPVKATLSTLDRFIDYRFTGLHPSAAISYLNQFNAPEHIWLFGSWKRSGKIKQSTAMIQAENTPYSLDYDPEFEITTHPIDFRQAYILPEIAMTPVLWAYLFAEGSPLATSAFQAVTTATVRSSLSTLTFKAVPTEGSLEASPQDTQPATHTIKIKALRKSAALGFQFQVQRIFTEQFNTPFI